jgi:plasmid stabilization system protein ParE
MNLRLTPRAVREAKRIKTWWRRHRPKSPDLFDDELDATIERVLSAPTLGTLHKQDDVRVMVFRILMPRTHHHLYYAVVDDDLIVLSVWGARKERAPKLGE